ncbi:MAG: CpaF/VirB11 family protein [Bacilli bacterium]|nr:CpaF/VirB11 family protein [Bacilli bacterium]
MDKAKVLEFIETSFLSEILEEKDVTDISFNGQDIYYVTNTKGRMKSQMVIDPLKIKDFLRQISNLCEAQFSFTEPILDLSIGRYRINAVHNAIAKVADEGVTTFSIRIASPQIRINDDSDFFTPEVRLLLMELIKTRNSIVIGGITSSGKTELQKYILMNLRANERVIVVDNVLELDQIRNPNIDLTCWLSDDANIHANPGLLIKNALRNNPDWIILAESRDKEMVDVLNSAMTGMPVITTLHSQDVFSMPFRMGRMMMKSEQKIDYEQAIKDINYHFHFYFYLKKKEVDGQIKRYVAQVMFVDNNGTQTLIYERNSENVKCRKLPQEAICYFDLNQANYEFKNIYLENYNEQY